MNISIKKFNKLKGGGGSQSRPIVEGVITPHADVVKQVKYDFVYTTPFRNMIAYFNDNTLKDLERKTPQLGDERGKGEYIIDLVYYQEDEGENAYRDAKSRIKDVIDNEIDRLNKYFAIRRDLEQNLQIVNQFHTEASILLSKELYNEIKNAGNLINITEARLVHLGYIQQHLMSFPPTQVHYPLQEVVEIKENDITNNVVLPIAKPIGGKRKKTRKKMKGGGGSFSRVAPEAYENYRDCRGNICTPVPLRAVSPEKYIYLHIDRNPLTKNILRVKEIKLNELVDKDWRIPLI